MLGRKRMKKLRKLMNLTAEEWNWVLYDIGNSAFILLVTAIVPIYFNALTDAAGLSEAQYMSYWGFATSLSTLLVALIGPICGTLADHKGYKKPIFTLCVMVGAIGCAGLGAAWSWLSFLAIFVVAKVGFNSSLVFYDSMLPDIASEERMDNVSSYGYAMGYIGSVIPFVACLVLVLFSGSFGLSTGTAMVIAFALTAAWWVGCTLPLLKTYQQKAYVELGAHPFADSFRRLRQTFREVKNQKHIFLYLLAFFFFIDGVYTIINMATAYGQSLGLDSTGLLLALLVTQIVAFPCSIIFGRLSARDDTGALIKICIVCYTGITLFGMFLFRLWQFWMLAVLVGMFQGGVQALSRSYLGKIIPPECSGEYYGLMDICGKGADAVGPAIIALISGMAGSRTVSVFGVELKGQNLGVGCLAVLFVIGFILFDRADKLNKSRKKANL